MATKNFKILGIDTSCDDTCAALLEVNNRQVKILSNVVSSQVKLHQKYGGVYPFLAKREHQKNLSLVFRKAAKDVFDIDLIGVTSGPGLEPCLWQGINFAQNLSEKFEIPIVPVNHVEAHILANFIDGFPKSIKSIKFPVVCLVVSGGHTGLILMKDIGKYKLIGETRDDAAGECFDKVARILDLSYPGGPAIAAAAAKLQITNYKLQITLPRPMINQKNYDFSFSGLKTAVLYNYRTQPEKIRKSKKYVRAMCSETQQAVIDVLIRKTLKAARDYKVKSIILGGGVAANEELRKQFKKKAEVFVPSKVFCTDNAAMVALTAFFHRSDNFKSIKAESNLRI